MYRALKTYTGDKLSVHNISTIDWALLGLLYDNSDGIRSSHLAEELGVEAPFVTVLFGKLKKMNLVDSKVDKNDSRVKNIFLTPKGKLFMPKVEAELFQELKIFIEDIPKKDVVVYLSVLEQIINNSKKVSLKASRHAYYEGV